MESIYILNEIYTPQITSKRFNIKLHTAGYYSSYELAAEKIKQSSQVIADMEDEELNPDEMFLCFIVEKKMLDNDTPYKNQGRWLFDRTGRLIDHQIIDDYSSESYKGRSPECIRFKKGDIVQCLDLINQQASIGIVTDVPPAKEELDDYEQNHPFIQWVGEEDCYQVAFGRESEGMYNVVDVIMPRTKVALAIYSKLKQLVAYPDQNN